jgi:multicomponent Na+:H+ antiporter subunit G
MVDTIGGIINIIGAALVALAGLGVLRFHDLFNRMHSATKASTLGILLIATGAALQLGDWAAGLKLFVAVSLIFITAPIAAHLVGRAAYPNWKRAQPPGGIDEFADRPEPAAVNDLDHP